MASQLSTGEHMKLIPLVAALTLGVSLAACERTTTTSTTTPAPTTASKDTTVVVPSTTTPPPVASNESTTSSTTVAVDAPKPDTTASSSTTTQQQGRGGGQETTPSRGRHGPRGVEPRGLRQAANQFGLQHLGHVGHAAPARRSAFASRDRRARCGGHGRVASGDDGHDRAGHERHGIPEHRPDAERAG